MAVRSEEEKELDRMETDFGKKDAGMISIVIPVYNAEKYIAATIQSVLDQTYNNWELLLVDDGSSDNTPAILASYTDSRIHVLASNGHKSAAKARNTGIRKAKGSFLAFLDADDIWQKDKLEKTLAFLLEKQAAFVFTGYEFGDENGVGTGKIVHVPKTLNYKQALYQTVIFTSTVLFDLTKLEKGRIYMPAVKSEDTATWWKILKSGVLAYGLDENLVTYRRSTGTLSSNKIEAIRRIWNLYKMQENLSLPKRLVCFVGWAFGAVARRV